MSQTFGQARRADIPEWTLADRLRKSLEHAGVEVDDMAQYLEVHPNTVRNWTRGRTRPRPSEVTLWAVRTGVSRDWLLPRVDSNHQPAGWRTSDQHLNRAEILAFRKTIRISRRAVTP